MKPRVVVVLEWDEQGFYAWCPTLQGCQAQGQTLDEALANVTAAIELCVDALSPSEKDSLMSRAILTTTVELKV
jgi:predicted RNase H-like HicB family nuclease